LLETTALSYELVEGWEQLPPGMSHPDVAGVATDSQDRVYLFVRNDPPVLVYDRDGRFLRSWGEGLFTPRAHGITIGPDDMVYYTDDADQTVRKFSPEGELLMTLGTKGQPSDTGYDGKELDSITHGGPPFNRPTNLAIAPNGELYVSDGYGNARVHRFSAYGRLIQSWGEPGTGPSEFHLSHGVWVNHDGRVFVADRQNDRLQIFSPDGEFLEMWSDVQRPTNIFIDGEGLVYVSELSAREGGLSYTNGPAPHYLPGRVSVFDPTGKLLARWGGEEPCAPGNFCAPHDIWVDSHGDIYVAEVTWTVAGRAGLVPPDCHTLQKFTRSG
jgi:streptogramin lyase